MTITATYFRVAAMSVLSLTAVIGGGNASAQGSTYTNSVSGNAGGANVTVTLTGATTTRIHADAKGDFQLSKMASGTYTLTPSENGFYFTPASRVVRVGGGSYPDLRFTAVRSTAPTYSLSGTVSGLVADDVIVTLAGEDVGSAATQSGGAYAFTGLPSGRYRVTAHRLGYAFTEPKMVTIGKTDAASIDFTSRGAANDAAVSLNLLPSLPQAIVGAEYSHRVFESVSGGTPSYSYRSQATNSWPPLGMTVDQRGNLTGIPLVAGRYTFTVAAIDADGNTTTPAPTTSITVVAASATKTSPVTTAAPTTAAAATPIAATTTVASTASTTASPSIKAELSGSSGISGTSDWVFHDGVYHWPVDYSWSVGVDYEDTGGAPLSGNSDVKVTVTGAYGGWAPVSSSSSSYFNDSSYASFTISLKPTIKNQKWNIYFIKPGESNSSGAIDPTNYGPAPVVGEWATYTIPLSVLGVTDASIYKFVVHDETGLSHNVWYADNVGFTNGKAVATSPTPTPTPTPTPAPTPVASGTHWVFYDGTFDWPGDYSFSAVPDYQDTSGEPLSGGHDVKVTLTGPYGGWLPYSSPHGPYFSSDGYTKLTFALKPTVANQKWNLYFVKAGDIPIDISVDPTNYGPAPVVGKWATYTVPLSDLGVSDTSIYKFSIHDETGLSYNVWYVDNVGFVP